MMHTVDKHLTIHPTRVAVDLMQSLAHLDLSHNHLVTLPCMGVLAGSLQVTVVRRYQFDALIAPAEVFFIPNAQIQSRETPAQCQYSTSAIRLLL